MPDFLRYARLTICWPLALNPLCHAYAQQTSPVREMALAAGIGAGRIESMSFSPDNRYLAVLTNVGFKILESQTGRERNSIVRYQSALVWDWQASPVALCWSSDGKQIAIASRELEIWDPFGKAPERTLPLDEDDTSPHDLTWSPSGDQIAARNDEAQIVLIDVHSGKRTVVPEPSDLLIGRSPSWSPNGRFLAILTEGDGESEAIHIWDVSRLSLIRQIRLVGLQKFGHGTTEIAIESSNFTRDPSLMAWAPKGDIVAVDSGLTGLSLWNASNAKFVRQFSQGNRFLSWSRDGTVLYAQAGHQIRLIDRLNGTARAVTENEDIVQGQAAVSPNGKYVAAIVDSRHEDEVDVWLAGKKKPLYQIPPSPRFELVNYAQGRDNSRIGLIGAQDWVSPDGRELVVQDDTQAQIIDTESARPVLPPFPGHVWVEWSLSGTLIVVGNYRGAGETRLIRSRDGSQVSSFMPAGFSALSPNEDLLARCTDNGVQVIRISDGTIVETIVAPPDQFQRPRQYGIASWSPNGRMILVEQLRTDQLPLDDAVFSIESRTLSSAPPGRGRLLWVGPQELVRTSIPKTSQILQSPDRRLALTLAQSSGPPEIRDLRTGKVIAGPMASPQNAVWSPDSTRIAYVTGRGLVAVWDVAAGRITESWHGPETQGAPVLRWPNKLVLVQGIGGAVRLWRQP